VIQGGRIGEEDGREKGGDERGEVGRGS